ncbi:MAG TPA: alpha/beta hydrolase [Chitinophagaceae bacterium]|nr:alpha/beta hydrolase [Chitinophagaceae bacterium]
MLRLIIAIVLLLSSLLVIFKAPLHFCWLLAVAITSYPLVFTSIALLVLLSAFWAVKFKIAVIAVCTVAIVLYCLPVVIAVQQNRYLPAQLAKAFNMPGSTINTKPFSITAMVTGLQANNASTTTVTYKTVGTTHLTLDFYPSALPGKSPLILVIHGGSWESGNSREFIDFNNYFAGKGYNVAAINYRLAPAYKSPAPMEDTRDAIAYLTANANQYNIDTGNIVLAGRSAGAQVALVYAYSAHNPGIKGVIDFYGPADMVWGGQAKTSKLMLDTRQIYNAYFGGVYSQVPQVFKTNSACEYVNVNTPPTLIIHGTIDAMVSHIHSEHLAEKLTLCNIRHYFLSLPFATHGCDYNINSPGGQVTTFATEQFLRAVTKH